MSIPYFVPSNDYFVDRATLLMYVLLAFTVYTGLFLLITIVQLAAHFYLAGFPPGRTLYRRLILGMPKQVTEKRVQRKGNNKNTMSDGVE